MENQMAKTKTKKPERLSLEKAAELGKTSAAANAKFIGWTKLPGRTRLMAGRYADGTVVYRGKDKAWVFGKPGKAA
jgi:hypothetical protein